jgi:hypothetical protein
VASLNKTQFPGNLAVSFRVVHYDMTPTLVWEKQALPYDNMHDPVLKLGAGRLEIDAPQLV